MQLVMPNKRFHMAEDGSAACVKRQCLREPLTTAGPAQQQAATTASCSPRMQALKRAAVEDTESWSKRARFVGMENEDPACACQQVQHMVLLAPPEAMQVVCEIKAEACSARPSGSPLGCRTSHRSNPVWSLVSANRGLAPERVQPVPTSPMQPDCSSYASQAPARGFMAAEFHRVAFLNAASHDDMLS